MRRCRRTLNKSLDDIKQALHIAPTELQNFMNIYQPAQGTLSGAPAFANFANPVAFLCGAIQAASRLGWDQSAKLCVQYLAPIIKNRQYNFPPLGENLVVGAMARPNEVTYSEDWMRPDYVPPPTNATAAPGMPPAPGDIHAANPADGLRGLMLPDRGWIVTRRRRAAISLLAALAVVAPGGCGWRGLNSVALPGTAGRGPGSFTIQAQLPDVGTLEQNSRVQVGDVTVGNVTKIERQGWHALLTIRLDGDVDLPANATVTIGQTSLLGSLHVELAPPADAPPRGKLKQGSLIPLSSAGTYPSTEQTLAAISLLLNGGGIGADPEHHPVAEHRTGRACRRPAQPDRTARHVHRTRQPARPMTSSPRPRASTTWSASSRTRSPWWTGR